MESQNHWQDAAFVYLDALDEVLQRGPYAVASPKQRTPQERMRGVALAQKIADLAQHSDVVVPPCPVASNGRTIDPAEGYLTWSVEEMLRLVREAADVSVPSESAVLLSDLHLPPWVTTEDVGGSIEALGAFYAARGLAEYAVPLYIQAVGLLLPTASGDAPHTRRTPPTVAERCRAAILMNNISQVLAQGKPPSSEAPVKPALIMLDQAISWAMKGLDIATITSFRAGFLQDMPEDEREWLLRFAGFDPKRIGTVAPVLETESEGRLVQVKQQCLGTQFVLLYNVAMFHSVRLLLSQLISRCVETRIQHACSSHTRTNKQAACSYAKRAHSAPVPSPAWIAINNVVSTATACAGPWHHGAPTPGSASHRSAVQPRGRSGGRAPWAGHWSPEARAVAHRCQAQRGDPRGSDPSGAPRR